MSGADVNKDPYRQVPAIGLLTAWLEIVEQRAAGSKITVEDLAELVGVLRGYGEDGMEFDDIFIGLLSLCGALLLGLAEEVEIPARVILQDYARKVAGGE